MQELRIIGGRSLRGSVQISGAKNAALPALAACLLTNQTTTLSNMPDVKDVGSMCALLEALGARISRVNDSISVDTSNVDRHNAPHELVRKMRASVLVMGPLLARFGMAEVALPGGCTIGNRPIDLHIAAMKKLGADATLIKGDTHLTASTLKGARIYFDRPTVTGTENVMMAATAADGETLLENAAREPEVVDLAELLVKMGANISGAGTDTIRVIGGQLMKGATHEIISDRIEAGTYAVSAAMTGGIVTLTHMNPRMISSLLEKMRSAGCKVVETDTTVTISGLPPFKPVDISTAEYPGFPTDLQAQFMAMMCLADGEAVITENIFEDRFKHVPELNRLGAEIVIRGRSAFVRGVKNLLGAIVTASDLRASASLVLAGLAAQDETRILRIYHLDRGYYRMEKKLSALGADIGRIDGEGP
ncbi:UDP-N-acetylglucosamine 1-carboxyvinyltransferase [bacterium]|nr:UDP-N-acetylglucosamine 1-carboxyvinyltransferase [candidate division CSSED10-310 bacterium]